MKGPGFPTAFLHQMLYRMASAEDAALHRQVHDHLIEGMTVSDRKRVFTLPDWNPLASVRNSLPEHSSPLARF